MDSSKPISLSAPKEFFSRALQNVFHHQRLSAQKPCFDYLVNLLVKFIESDKFFVKTEDGRLEQTVLCDLYIAYRQGDHEEKKAVLQRLGDVSLLVTGFFSDSLNRKILDVDYYFGMGGSAYLKLATLVHHPESRNLYQELASKFKPFSNAINEVSEQGGLQSNKDLLRVYEKWLLTGSDHLKSLLSENGISLPLKIDPKLKH